MTLSLAAVLIVRNEARCIVRCLESVRSFVDRIVVLDTGSTDETVALAQGCGAQVHHMDWPGDFAVARNRALDLADADWNLVIDADEWIEAGGERLRGWCQGPVRLGRVCVHSVFDVERGDGEGEPATRSWITRLLPRGVRFRGRVHEQAVSDLPRERLEVHLGHDGYLDQQLAGKQGRNRPLLLADLRDHPGDPYIAYQLGKDAEGRDAHAEACDWYGESLAATPEGANWRHELVVRYLHCLGQAGRAEQGLALAEEEMPLWSQSPDFFFAVGNLALEQALGDPGQAIEQWLPLAVGAWERCLEIGEQPDLEGSVRGRGSHLAQHNLDVVRSQLERLGG